MNFLERIFAGLAERSGEVVLEQGAAGTTGADLLRAAALARGFLRARGVRKGDRVVLLGDNGARWVALDLAIMAEGALTVPLYARQKGAELEAMVRDCDPALVLCGSPALLDAAPGASRRALFAEAEAGPVPGPPLPLGPDDRVRIVYTSGTSGEAKGVLFQVSNLDFMLPRTSERLDRLMAGVPGPERAFHYLPFCFAGSWILLLTCLARRCRLVLATDLQRLREELREADPHYGLHVPLVLERMRAAVEERVRRVPRLLRPLLRPFVRRGLAPSLRALVCGSAPLAAETQRFFIMWGLPVLQVYGLTETTAICTMDEPGLALPGRVGAAIEGCEMRVDEGGEILVRGPNVFPGYWNRPPREGWLRTGDRGDVDALGRWRILGRAKNVLVLSSGHNVAPEPLEERIVCEVPGARQAVVVGHGRPHLAAIVAGEVDRARAEEALERIGRGLPHYERIRAFHLHPAPFGVDEGLLTANGKVRRGEVLARFADEVEALYR